jgi:hypothetical protein
MVRAGDISHGRAHSHNVTYNAENEKIARLCKTYLEIDRNMHMREQGYETSLQHVMQSELTGKGELLVGISQEAISNGTLRWPWKKGE